MPIWNPTGGGGGGGTGLSYKGTWDANANNPALGDGGVGGVQGDYFIVGTAGTTSIDGEADWGVGDWIVHNGSNWQKIDNSETPRDLGPFTFGRSQSTSNVYLQVVGGSPSNLTGYVIAHDARIIGLAAKTDGAHTWTAEIRKNGVATPITSISMTAEAKKTVNGLSVDINAGDELQGYCNGNAITRPLIIVYLERR